MLAGRNLVRMTRRFKQRLPSSSKFSRKTKRSESKRWEAAAETKSITLPIPKKVGVNTRISVVTKNKTNAAESRSRPSTKLNLPATRAKAANVSTTTTSVASRRSTLKSP